MLPDIIRYPRIQTGFYEDVHGKKQFYSREGNVFSIHVLVNGRTQFNHLSLEAFNRSAYTMHRGRDMECHVKQDGSTIGIFFSYLDAGLFYEAFREKWEGAMSDNKGKSTLLEIFAGGWGRLKCEEIMFSNQGQFKIIVYPIKLGKSGGTTDVDV